MKNLMLKLGKNISLQLLSLSLIIGFVSFASLILPNSTPDGETPGGLFMNFFNKILVNTGTTSDGLVKDSDKVDGLHANELIAADLGSGTAGGACYYTNSSSCLTGYQKASGTYNTTDNCITLAYSTNAYGAVNCPVGFDFKGSVYLFNLGAASMVCCGGGVNNNICCPKTSGESSSNVDFVYNGVQYDAMPGGCGNTTNNPVCNGTDFVQKTNSDAISYCSNMIYAGFTDWYLPSQNELSSLFQNKDSIGGFYSSAYWSSTNTYLSDVYSYLQDFSSINTYLYPSHNNNTFFVRCIRKI